MNHYKPLAVARPNDSIFAVLAAASMALDRVGKGDRASDLLDRVHLTQSHDEALAVVREFVRLEGDPL